MPIGIFHQTLQVGLFLMSYFPAVVMKDNLKYLGQCFEAFGLRLYDDFQVQNK
jgi:hypothetical protein